MSTDPSLDDEPLEDDLDPVEVDLSCDECGAPLTWDPVADALSCGHCGATRVVPREEGTILERPLAEAGQAMRGLGIEVRVSRCGNCGARVSFAETSTSTQCLFCGSPSLLDQEANRNAIRPESLIPLDVGREAVRAQFIEWVSGLWFRPNALKKTRDFEAVGVYVPAWTFDADVWSDWSADSGTYYWVSVPYTTTVNGKTVTRTRRERRVRWRPAWGDRHDAYNDLVVMASHAIDVDLAQRLGDFDTGELVPYRPEFLAGWHAEEYQLDLEGGWDVARDRITEEQRRRCAGDVPGDTHRNLRVKNQLRDIRWKHVLLPVWSLTYEYGGKSYAVLVHGQTGRVAGSAPLSWTKILLLVTLLAVIVGIIVIASN